MRTNDIQGELGAELEPGPLAIGPDGAHLTDNARTIPPPPRLCEAGPCRHYHRFVTQLDAERPLAAVVMQGPQHGRLEGDGGPQPFHIKVHHYCYPTVGIEMDLGAMPVLECNHWDPATLGENRDLEERREFFLASRDGHEYRESLAAWKAARAAEESAAADLPAVSSVVVVIGGHEHTVPVDGAATIKSLRESAVLLEYPLTKARRDFADLVAKFQILDSQGNEITNLDATIHQLGIADGELITLVLPAGHGG